MSAHNERAFHFKIVKRDRSTRARLGILHTPHGDVETPVFMPVGTAATVKALPHEWLEELGVGILLANTYHLYLRPGHERIAQLGGLHRFMAWQRAILTDSGGFQVFSHRELRTLSEEGAHFQSHLDGSRHVLTPEKAIEIQNALGSDIAMVLDECTPYPCGRADAEASMELSMRWARRSRTAWGEPNGRALFGIVQGGMYPDLRRRSVESLVEVDFDGIAVGGLSVGEPKSVMHDVLEATLPLIPEDRPRYLMGVGTPEDIAAAVALGVDMFDCVLPTRNARNGCLFTSEGRLMVKNARYADDPAPPDPACGCRVCRRYSRAYLRHLFQAGEHLSAILNTFHNVAFYLDTMRGIRKAIEFDTYGKYLERSETRADG